MYKFHLLFILTYHNSFFPYFFLYSNQDGKSSKATALVDRYHTLPHVATPCAFVYLLSLLFLVIA